MNLYILNPGDGLEVRTFSDVHLAWEALDAAGPHGRLYHYQSTGPHDWLVYASRHWCATNTNVLPIKVIEAAKGGA